MCRAFSLVEVIVALAVFLVFVTTVTQVTSGTHNAFRFAVNYDRAGALADEGLEAVRNIRDQNFANLEDGTYGLSASSGQWEFSGQSDSTDIFTRTIEIDPVSTHQKKVTSTVTWSDPLNANRSIVLSSYVTDWRKYVPDVGLTVNKVVVNHGGSKTASDFAPYEVGTTTVTLGEATALAPGTYTVSENTDPDYTVTFSGDCDSTGEVTLSPGDAKVCTITNEEKAAQIVVNKVVINNGSSNTADHFAPYLVGSIPVTLGVATTFDSGTYTVSENYDPNYYIQTFSGDCNASGSVTLTPGTTKTCTITNEERSIPPTVTSPTVTSITSSGATLGATVTSLGSPAVISARGICIGTTPTPTTNCVAEGGTTTGVFTQARTGLTPGTTYYFRGYATNAAGTAYSADGTFTTLGGACTITGIVPTTYDSPGSTSGTIAKPTGIAQNDIMFAYVMHNNASDRLTTIPAGWSEIGRHRNGSSNQALFYKVAGANEPASYTFGLSASSRFAITINSYRGCFDPAMPIETTSNVEYIVNNTTYRAASMTLSAPYTTILMFPSVNSNGARTFAAPTTQGGGWTQDYANGNSSSQFSRNAFRKLMPTAGATGVIDSIGFSASTGKHAFAVALKPL